MKIGSMNDPRLNVLDEIDRIGRSNFDFIDLTYEWPSNMDIDAKKVKMKLGEYALGVIGHTSPSLPAIYPSGNVKKACMEELKKAVDFFKVVGVDRMNIHPFYFSNYKEEEIIIESNIIVLSELLDYCSENQIALMLENFRKPFDNVSNFKKIIEVLPGLKVHIDVGHLNFSCNVASALGNFLAEFNDNIYHCHIHDNNGEKDEHLPLGCGNIDWLEIIKILKKYDYNKTFTLEIFCHDRHYLSYSREKWQYLWGEA